jgi:hypothetical protein
MRYLLIVALAVCVPAVVQATSDGPSYLKVRGVRADDTLQIRAEPYPSAPALGALAADASQVPNLGCLEAMDLVSYLKTLNIPSRVIDRVKPGEFWCKIRHPEMSRVVGWVNGRFTAEDTSTPQAAEKSDARQPENAHRIQSQQPEQPRPELRQEAQTAPLPKKVTAEQAERKVEADRNVGLQIDGMSMEESLDIRRSFGLRLFQYNEPIIACKSVDVAQQCVNLSLVKRNRENEGTTFADEMIQKNECVTISPGTPVQVGHKQDVDSLSCVKLPDRTYCLWAYPTSKASEYQDLAYLAARVLTGHAPHDGWRYSENHLLWINPPRIYMNAGSDPYRAWQMRHVIVRSAEPDACVVDEVFVKPNHKIDSDISRRYRFSNVELKRGLKSHGAMFDGTDYYTMSGERSYCTLQGHDALDPEEGSCSNEMKFARFSSSLLVRETSEHLKEIFDRFCHAR